MKVFASDGFPVLSIMIYGLQSAFRMFLLRDTCRGIISSTCVYTAIRTDVCTRQRVNLFPEVAELFHSKSPAPARISLPIRIIEK